MLDPTTNPSPETTRSITDVIAPVLGVGLALVGFYVLFAFWQGRQRRRAVNRLRERGPRPLDQAPVGLDVWVLGDVRTTTVQRHPIDESECVYWSVTATHLVNEKDSNDAGHSDRRRELFSESAGEDAIVESKDGSVALSVRHCERKTLEGDSYTAETLPPAVSAWLQAREVDIEAKGLEVDVFHMPVGARVSALGRVRRVDDNDVRWLDDAGPAGLAISIDCVDDYMDSLASGQLATLAVGLGFVGFGAALIGRFFFG